jgi:arylsulfatase A-like enzyme
MPASEPNDTAGDFDRPNILYILADDLGYGEVGCYGQEIIQTPSLDRMAEEGMRFTRHFAGGPVCGPSRACLMTGQSQAIGYIKGNAGGKPERENLREKDTTVAELLSDSGYETACIGKWGLGPEGMSGYPTRKGFDRFIGYDTHRSAHDYYPESLCHNEGRMKLADGTYSHDVFTREALSWLKEDRDDPFFLYLAYTIPHSPYNPPDLGPYADRDWPEIYKKYASMITRMDRDVGRILDYLVETGQAENTLVIFTSDNGPQSSYGEGENEMTRFFNSNGIHRGIKRDVYNGGIIEPFIAWCPGTIAPATSTDHVSGFQDFLPTVCEMLDIDAEVETDGLSYLPVLLGSSQDQEEHDRFYWEYIRMGQEHGGRQSVLDVQRNVKGVRFGRFSDIELYDLSKDPEEENNIADEESNLAKELTHYLDSCRTESDLWPISMHDEGWMPPES